MNRKNISYDVREHSANYTDDFVFNMLIPYIGNKRKLLPLIQRALTYSGIVPEKNKFVDLFSGTGVVARFAKAQGFSVIANDWEPYSESINQCFIGLDRAPKYSNGSYDEVLAELNALPDREDWVTRHLCPDDDAQYDIRRDRMFYMRKNGLRIDAIRHRIREWEEAGLLDQGQLAALLAPLIYQCCYNSNTSGVFKGFHNGWGGQTGTALYRICGDLALRPATFHDNGRRSEVVRCDATALVRDLGESLRDSFVYLDPPYNQHPYGSNYHVLNSVALWDKPSLPTKITGHGDKSAIRMDWRTERRSAYNTKKAASREYSCLLESTRAAWIATSYSTDGTIPLEELVKANHHIGGVEVFSKGYKRYRVSSQRFSEKPMNLEFILLLSPGTKATRSVDEIVESIKREEETVLSQHPENDDRQLELI